MHRSHSLALAATVAALIAAPLAAQTTLPAYAPGTARYRLVTTINATQVAMGQTQNSESRGEEVHTVTITKAGDGLAQTMTFDSATTTSNPPVPAPDVAALTALKYTATMGADGKVSTSTVSDKSGAPAPAELASLMRSFLPRIKPGAKVGDTWTDSSSQSRRQNGADVTNTLNTSFTLAGDTTVAGAKAWKINATSSGKLSGAGNQQGADYTLNGTVSGRGTLVVSTTGVFLGGNLASDVNMTIDVPMASIQIPVTQKQTTTISKLP